MEKKSTPRRDGLPDRSPGPVSDAIVPVILQRLLEIGKLVLAESGIDCILNVALDYFIEISGAERGMVTCFDEDGEPSFEATWNLPGEGLAHPDFEISRKIIAKVKSAREPICLCHALEAPAPEKSHSTPRLKTLSVICLPLCHERKIFGIVYLDNRTISGAFTPEKFRLIRSFADFVSLAACCALQAKRQQNRVYALEAELRARCDFEAIVGHHPRLLEILKLVAQIADTDATVLIQGESGTGKELIARALHCNSRRQHHPFVPINCGALPENLLESELFGHVRGAFTGAVKNKLGWFERANGGTIFLDEISKMTPALQAKLLRVLQTGEYSPVGSAEIRHCDVRILAATNKDLQELINAGAFQEDLYYRLNVIDIMLPPLRDRRSDIPVLIQHFLRSLSEKYRKENTDNSQIESIISEKNVDILLLEVLSKNASEIEMIKTVRNRCPDTEIILIDGDADRDLIAAAFSYGIRDAFRKPYNRVLIVERVYALLRRLRRAKHAIED